MISFVLPAHNETQLLAATLAALHGSARTLHLPYEIVVVDDASSDATAQVALDGGARVLCVEHRHIAATRNAGARAALGEWLVFVDADTLVNPQVLQAAVRELRDGAAGGGAAVHLQGPIRWHESLGVWLFVWIFRLTRIAPGCFIFCSRAAFEAAGGFDEEYYAAEDITLSRALARQGRFVILREPVRTSARKLRTHGLGEHLRLLWRMARHRRRMLTSRQHLDLWYGARRSEDD
ncbi:MAG TPA: glycosyltransferase [Pseudoxanthomonas sp.]|nr:glycosyltransferase [Pseudoxanthomonas sp.]